MKKENVFIIILALIIAGQAGYTHYQLTQLKKQITGVAVLQVLTNSQAAALFNEMSQTSNIKDGSTRSVLHKRIVNRYANNSGLLFQEAGHAEKN